MALQEKTKFRLGEPKYFTFGGIRYAKHQDMEVMEEMCQHTFDSSDILVASFPKSGKATPVNFTSHHILAS